MSLLPESNTKFSASDMVLGVISSKGDVMLPHFCEMGQRWSTPEVLDTLMKPWMETVAGECPYVFQPGQSPAHTTKITQAFLKVNLKDHCPKEIWPPSSLD